MKRIMYLLLLILLVQSSYCLTSVLAQQQEEEGKIFDTIKAYYRCYENKDIDCLMLQVSKDYLDIILLPGKEPEYIDYDTHKSNMGKYIEGIKRYSSFSVYNVKMPKLDLKDGKAVAHIEFSWKGYNPIKQREQSGEEKRFIHLAKENGLWMITSVNKILK